MHTLREEGDEHPHAHGRSRGAGRGGRGGDGRGRDGRGRDGRGRGRRGRVPRGDIRAAILLLLAEEPMHGYQLMQTIADRTGGRWTPSPGAVYPSISQLEDEALVSVTAEAGRKLVTLTDSGRDHVEAHRQEWPDPFTGYDGAAPDADLRALLDQLHGAARQVARTGSEAQRTAAVGVLAEARRSLYLLLADGPEPSDD